VAGIVGGARYGVAKRVTLLGVRVLPCSGSGTNAAVIAGIDWVRGHAIKPAVANISIGGGLSSAENTAVTNLINSGVFVAVAAGNSNVDACTTSPSSAAGTVTVAAADWYDTKASYSNWGACVDLYAPGTNVKSDWLNGATNTISGTSMASPHVAGVAALLKGDYGDQTSATIASWILNAATTNVVQSNVSGTPNRLLYMSGW
jgi:subtilisin family serine protease